MGASAPVVVVALFLASYTLHHAVPPSAAPLALTVSTVLLVAAPLFLLLRRVSEIMMAVDPISDTASSAVFIAGCDRSAGWFTALRLCEMGVRVYAGFEEPSSAQAQWLKRYLKEHVYVVRLRGGHAGDARDAATYVSKTLGIRALVAAVYAVGTVPKVTDSLDVSEVQRGIELNALGAVAVSQHFGPLLQKFGGRYVILTDLAGRVPLPSILPYCMAQNVAHQFINAIRKDMEKLAVTVHVIEPLLFTWECLQSKECYPATSEDDGKVIFSRDAQKIDYNVFDITQSIHHACFAKSPKAHYLPRTNDVIMDKIISYAPRCLLNWTARHVEEVTNINVPPLEKGWEE